MEMTAAAGEWEGVEHAKRELVAYLAADAARHPGAPAFPLWDFSGYSSVTTEPLPDAGSRAEMRFYWDSSHFKERVGDWVLDRVLATVSTPDAPPPADFGVLLTPDSVEAALAGIRAARDAYRARHAGEVAQIEALVADALRPSVHQGALASGG
jgi:hypothetical protein